MKNGMMIIMLLVSSYSMSQKAQPVYGIVKDRQEMSWYAEQEGLWKKEIDAGKKNAIAWCNYYEAVRAQYLLTDFESKERETFKIQMDQIVKDLYAQLPDSFEANYLMYRNFSKPESDEYFKYLERAFEISPQDPRTYDLFITEYEINRNKTGFHDFCVREFNANEFPPGVYNWAYNMLSEVDENAILFTCGDLDTYPLWCLQEAKNFRKDVRIINTSLLMDDAYRAKIFAEMGLSPFNKKVADCKTEEEHATLKKEVFAHIFTNKKNIPVYVAGTAVTEFQAHFSDNLYMTGLTYKYSVESIDNISLLRRNYEKRYLLDYLTTSFSFHAGEKMVDRANSTYLPSFVKLYLHYKDAEETDKMLLLKNYIVEISKKADCYEDVIKLIGE